jgi:hypothetical protein
MSSKIFKWSICTSACLLPLFIATSAEAESSAMQTRVGGELPRIESEAEVIPPAQSAGSSLVAAKEGNGLTQQHLCLTYDPVTHKFWWFPFC